MYILGNQSKRVLLMYAWKKHIVAHWGGCIHG
jgi:hypothetical protein